MVEFKVLLWDWNSKSVEYYDIMSFLDGEWRELMKHKRRKDFHKPSTYDEVKEWILGECRYQFWSRSEYELVVSGFPSNGEQKIDAYDQIEASIDLVVRLFMLEHS